MPSSHERLTLLEKRVKEYEQIIAQFEATNGNLRMRRGGALPEIQAYCDRHIAMNTSALESMRSALAVVKKELAETRVALGK